MKLFTGLYEKVMGWSKHPKALYYLGALSFAESSFFPIPPDVMLAPMSVARPNRAWWFAFITTITSVLGGVFGYFIGAFAFEYIGPWLQTSSYLPKFEMAKAWFSEWGVWVVFVAGFSPIPYKLFTVTAGVLSLALIPFVVASFIGRGSRFFLVAGILKYAGPKLEPLVMKYVEWIGWITVLLLVAVVLYFKLLH
ncbi:MAG: YqaA family protein [Gammaproteobacteria bacterium]